MDYRKRISSLRSGMQQQKLDAALIPPDASWEYMAGIPRLGIGNTRQRQNSLEFACLLVTAEQVIAFLPQLSYIVTQAKLRGIKPPNCEFRVYRDGDLTGATFNQEIKRLGLAGKRVGVNQDISASLVLKLQSELNVKVENITGLILQMRSIKDADEIRIIREAVEITDSVFDTLVPQLQVGVSVREMEFEIDSLLEEYGASMSSFPSEVNTHGPKSGHMVGYSHRTLEKGYVIGVDFGVVYKGYCTDFGRTLFVGEPDQEYVNIYNLVREAQDIAMQMLPFGRHTCEEVDAAARAVIEIGGYGDRFIHKLGHGIGLDVHERPFLAKGEAWPLKPGMIFAVEPSIFIPQKCFIRLEDSILVTEDGCEMLSHVNRDFVIID